MEHVIGCPMLQLGPESSYSENVSKSSQDMLTLWRLDYLGNECYMFHSHDPSYSKAVGKRGKA